MNATADQLHDEVLQLAQALQRSDDPRVQLLCERLLQLDEACAGGSTPAAWRPF